jgi:hypothetical protein
MCHVLTRSYSIGKRGQSRALETEKVVDKKIGACDMILFKI